MIRWSVLAAGAVAVMGAAFVTGAAVPTKTARPPNEVKADARPPVAIGPRTGYFNMAKVMRDSRKAKTALERLNARRERLAANLVGVRNMYTDLQAVAQKPTTGAKKKDETTEDMRMLARQIEDMDRALNKMLNERASVIIVEIYDDIRAVTTAVAQESGLVALLAFPDAVTREEAENPLIKELKLKPPALQPFYLDPSVDYSDEILRRLNDKFAAESGEE